SSTAAYPATPLGRDGTRPSQDVHPYGTSWCSNLPGIQSSVTLGLSSTSSTAIQPQTSRPGLYTPAPNQKNQITSAPISRLRRDPMLIKFLTGLLNHAFSNGDLAAILVHQKSPCLQRRAGQEFGKGTRLLLYL